MADPIDASGTRGVPSLAAKTGSVDTLCFELIRTLPISIAVFDRQMLAQLGMVAIATSTPWFDGVARFEGPLMSRIMQAVGASGETLTAIALNDYSIDIPIADFQRFGTILAKRRDGAPMRVAEKGPLFIIYPYDANPELRSRQYYSRSVWSVSQFVVR